MTNKEFETIFDNEDIFNQFIDTATYAMMRRGSFEAKEKYKQMLKRLKIMILERK